MTNRRTFMQSVLAGFAAPYVGRADALMRVYPSQQRWGVVRTELPIAYVDPLKEESVRTRLSPQTVKVTYTYATSFGLLLPEGVESVVEVRADEHILSKDTYTVRDGIIHFKQFALTDYGGRVPSFQADLNEREVQTPRNKSLVPEFVQK